MASVEEEFILCNYCLHRYSNDDVRQVKIRAVEFIRDYLDRNLIKLNRICINCINNNVRTVAYQENRAMILNSKFLDIDYFSNSIELNLTLQYIDRNRNPSVRITSRFLFIITIEQIIDYLIQALVLPLSSSNLLLTMIRTEYDRVWYPIIYDPSTTLYQLDIKTNSYLRFEFSLETKRNKLNDLSF